jgi:hypothetical protein
MDDDVRQDVRNLLAHASQLEFHVEIVQAALHVRHLFLFRRLLLGGSAQRPGLQVGEARLQDPGPQPMEHGFSDSQLIAGLGDPDVAGDRLENHLQPFLGAHRPW